MNTKASYHDDQTCTCNGNTSLATRHAFGGVLRTLLAIIVPGLLFACLWGLIDFFLKFNSLQPPPLWLPFTAPFTQISSDQKMSEFDRFVDVYNFLFPGACRFGSGIGMVAGGFWSVGRVKKGCFAENLSVGILAGSLLFARIMLMATSKAEPVIYAFFVGAVVLPIYLLNRNRLYSAPSLPRAEIDAHFRG
jgi:hypothetical protein